MSGGALVAVPQPIRVAGHFGEFFQGRIGPEGPVVLVTVPCATLGVEAEVEAGAFAVEGPVDGDVARGFLEALGDLPHLRITLSAGAPAGAGAGMSTASLLALAQAAGLAVDTTALVKAEGAVDPLMLEAPGEVLWASREARVVRRFAPLPEFTVVGGFFGAPERTQAADVRFPDVTDIVDFWESAAERGDRAALAGIATEAARRTTALRGPEGDPTEELAREWGALGIVRAHTGSARGLLFAPERVPGGVEAALTEAGFGQVLTFNTGGGA